MEGGSQSMVPSVTVPTINYGEWLDRLPQEFHLTQEDVNDSSHLMLHLAEQCDSEPLKPVSGEIKDALNLYKQDKGIQDAVKDAAMDCNILHAFIKNDTVRALLGGRLKKQQTEALKKKIGESYDALVTTFFELLKDIWNFMKHKMDQAFKSLTSGMDTICKNIKISVNSFVLLLLGMFKYSLTKKWLLSNM